MDGVVKKIKVLAGTLNNYEKLVESLRGQSKILANSAPLCDSVLESELKLVNQYTIGWCFLLHGKASSDLKYDVEYMARQIRHLCLHGDQEQLVMCSKEFSILCETLAQILTSSRTTKWITYINPLQTAIQKIVGTNRNLLTPAHALFALVCLKAMCFDAALSIIDVPIFNVDVTLSSLDYLSYFYYCGMIYTGLKNYKKAIENFRLTLIVSTSSLSVIQVESFKKLVLVNLIAEGTTTGFDVATGLGVNPSRDLKSCVFPYTSLADVATVASASQENLLKVVAKHIETFTKDGNFGLVKQVQSAQRRRAIRKLTDTYVTLSLDDMAARAGLSNAAEAERYVLQMIQDGEIFARLDQENGMITFHDNPEHYDSLGMIHKLDGKISEIMRLSNKLKDVHQQIVVTKKHVELTIPKVVEEDATDRSLMEVLARSKNEF